MRERHRQRFLDATAKLKEQHKNVVKRNKILELQLIKNSVSLSGIYPLTYLSIHYIYLYIYVSMH